MADWRLLAAVVLVLGCACEATRSRPSPAASSSGTALASSSNGVPETTGADAPGGPIPLEDLNAILGAKTRAATAVNIGAPARWKTPFQLTTRAGRSPFPPFEAISRIVLGGGWGCAELDAGGDRYRACWLSPSAAERERGRREVRAQPVPWLGVWPVATAERLCARVGPQIQCWPALELLKQRPADIPEPKAWRREGQVTQYSLGVAAAPSFECALSDGALACQGSDPFGVLARKPLKDVDLSGWPLALALGHHHGCVRQELDVSCWGRGDHGELGFAPSEQCQDGASTVACSRQLGRVPLQGERESHPPLLVAGDTYTCAVTENFVECWGASRDGFFSAPGPARVTGLRLDGINGLSAGPRGLCGSDYRGGTRCVGGIGTPPPRVTRVAVSQGDDASACGVDEDGIVCWGEAYSPHGRPRSPARIRIEHVPDLSAPVLDNRGRFDRDCRIKRPCTREWTQPPRCEEGQAAEPWATLAPHAAAERGKLVSVTGYFVVGPGMMTLAGCGRWGKDEKPPPNPPTVCCNGSWAPLGLVSEDFALRLEGMECEGDESRLCCSAPATGQAIVATGRLEWIDGRGDSGWTLLDPKLCSLD